MMFMSLGCRLGVTHVTASPLYHICVKLLSAFVGVSAEELHVPSRSGPARVPVSPLF